MPERGRELSHELRQEGRSREGATHAQDSRSCRTKIGRGRCRRSRRRGCARRSPPCANELWSLVYPGRRRLRRTTGHSGSGSGSVSVVGEAKSAGDDSRQSGGGVDGGDGSDAGHGRGQGEDANHHGVGEAGRSGGIPFEGKASTNYSCRPPPAGGSNLDLCTAAAIRPSGHQHGRALRLPAGQHRLPRHRHHACRLHDEYRQIPSASRRFSLSLSLRARLPRSPHCSDVLAANWRLLAAAVGGCRRLADERPRTAPRIRWKWATSGSTA